MLIAWGDIECPRVLGFVTIPPINANALYWCLILHLMGEFRAFFRF
jgi:hypothetical protein